MIPFFDDASHYPVMKTKECTMHFWNIVHLQKEMAKCPELTDTNTKTIDDIRKLVVEGNLRLVGYVLKRMHLPVGQFDAAISEGNMGLVRAASKFDVTRGWVFSTYASASIMNNIRSINRKSCILNGCLWRLRLVLSTRDRLRENGLEPTSKAVVEYLNVNGPDNKRGKWSEKFVNQLDHIQSSVVLSLRRYDGAVDVLPVDDSLNGIIQKALGGLTPQESTVVTMKYGLNGEREHTFQEISKVFNVTRSRIQQIDAKAKHKLSELISRDVL